MDFFIKTDVFSFEIPFLLMCQIDIIISIGFVLNRQQAITWTDHNQILWCQMASLGFDEFIHDYLIKPQFSGYFNWPYLGIGGNIYLNDWP